MSIRKWWEELDDIMCIYNGLMYCEQYPTCEICPLHPKNFEEQSISQDKSNTLECKQLTIEDIENEFKKG